MASSSDRKLNSSASRASKPTFRRAGGRSGAPAKPQRNTIAHSKSVGHARQTSRPVVGSQLGNRPAAKKSSRPSVTSKPVMGAKPARPMATPKPSTGAKAARPGRTLGASKPRSLTSVPATAKKPSGKKGVNPLSSLGRWQIKHQTPLLSLQAKAKSWAAFWPSLPCSSSLPSW